MKYKNRTSILQENRISVLKVLILWLEDGIAAFCVPEEEYL